MSDNTTATGESPKSGYPTLPEPSAASYRRAHDRLQAAFDQVRATCAWVDGPIGRVYIARTRVGVCRVSFHDEDRLMRELERRRVLPSIDASALERERRDLDDYFEGRLRRRFRWQIDLRFCSEFQRRVLEAAREIPFGQVESYSEIAERIDQPTARRAVGNALGKNPVGIVIPCHRVIAADGSIGGYTGGVDIKRILMKIEGVQLQEKQT